MDNMNKSSEGAERIREEALALRLPQFAIPDSPILIRAFLLTNSRIE